jgi:xanthine/uracil permease
MRLPCILGIVFAFLSVLTISSVATYAIYRGFGAAAASIMATCVVGVIIAFIQRRKLNKEERKN